MDDHEDQERMRQRETAEEREDTENPLTVTAGVKPAGGETARGKPAGGKPAGGKPAAKPELIIIFTNHKWNNWKLNYFNT